jgi:hypothetical protein
LPDRVIRDELLTSERYWSVSIEAQRLFIHVMLCADDLGRFSGKNYTIRAACFPGQAIPAEKVEKLLAELQDSDLVRVYQSSGERFLFVPRFRQRLRFKTSRYPSPPKEISDISEEKSDIGQTQDGHKSDTSPPKRREEKRREEKQATPPNGGSLWDLGVALLHEQGLKEASARSFIASCLRDWQPADVEAAFRAAAGKADAKSYVLGVLKQTPKKGGQKVTVDL